MARAKTLPKIPRITQLESGAYHCQVSYNGKRLSITEPDYNECLARVLDIIAKRKATAKKRNGGGSDGLIQAKRDLTLRQAIDLYIESRTNVLSPSTIRGYRSIQKNMFQSVVDKKLSDTLDIWQELINNESKKLSAKTVRNAWGLVHRVLTVNGIKAPEVNLPQVIRSEHEFFEPEEVLKFIECAKGNEYELVFLLGLHGLRCSEIYAIDVKKHIRNGVIRVRGAMVHGVDDGGKIERVWKDTNKNTASRRDVPIIIPRVTELISAAGKKAKDPQTVLSTHPDSARKYLRKVCEENGLPYVGLHGLRHSFASLCYHLGISEAEIMRMGGWSDPGVLRKIYTHIANKDKLASESKLKTFFSAKPDTEAKDRKPGISIVNKAV